MHTRTMRPWATTPPPGVVVATKWTNEPSSATGSVMGRGDLDRRGRWELEERQRDVFTLPAEPIGITWQGRVDL